MESTENINPTLDTLTALGGSLWERGDMRRVYFEPAQWLGLNFNRYNSGNISSATLNGEKISNSMARRLIAAVDKIWFDLDTGAWQYQAASAETAQAAIAAIRGAVEAQ